MLTKKKKNDTLEIRNVLKQMHEPRKSRKLTQE